MLVSVVLSFRNEEKNVEELVRRLRLVFAEAKRRQLASGHELVFVDDASTDRSVTLLRELGREGNDIRILTMSRRFGVAECAMAGFHHAKGDAVVTMDSDLQDPPEVILSMLEAVKANDTAQVVHTVRTLRKAEPFYKKILTRIGYRLIRSLSYLELQIEAGDFKLLRRPVVDHLIALNEKLPYLRGMVVWAGFKQVTVSYEREARFAGTTHFPVLGWKVIDNFLFSALVSFGHGLLRLPLVVGALCFGAGSLGAIASVLLPAHLPASTAILSTVVAMGGLCLGAIGIIGLYVNLIVHQVKQRPLYIVEREENFTAAGRSRESKLGAPTEAYARRAR